MKKIIILVLLGLMGLEASAQKINLAKLGNTLRNKNLDMWYEIKGDRFVVRDNATNRMGIMNLKGKMLIQPKYQNIVFLYNGGLIYFKISDTTYSLMNHQGQWVVENEHDYLIDMLSYSTVDKFLPVPGRGKWGLVDSLGNWLMPMEYLTIDVDDSERGWVITEEGLYDVYKKRLLLQEGINWTHKIGNNLYAVGKRGDKVGIIDTLGQWVVEPEYDWIHNESEGFISFSKRVHTVAQDTVIKVGRDGYRRTTYYYRNYGFMDRQGREVIPAQFDETEDFNNGYAKVMISGKWGYIDTTGKMVVPCKYEYGSEFQKNGKAWVMTESGDKSAFHLIDGQGNILSTVEDREVVSFEKNTIIWFLNDDKYMVTDYDGMELARYDDILYDDITLRASGYSSEEDMIAVRQGSKWGFADRDYLPLIPCHYRKADGYGNGPGGIVTLQDGSTRYIDREGKTILNLDGLAGVRKVGKDLYKVIIYADGDRLYQVGLADGKGHSTFSKEELETARRTNLKQLKDREEEKKEEDRIVHDFSIELVDTIPDDQVKSVPMVMVVDSLSNDPYDEVFVVIDEDPMFPGGMDSLYAFLKANIQYPEEAKRDSIEGKVFVQFVIGKDGSVNPQTIKVRRDIGGGCGEEVVRVIKLMPRWIPGRQNGKVVRCEYILPVKFELNKEE